jgi:hypothetical protein
MPSKVEKQRRKRLVKEEEARRGIVEPPPPISGPELMRLFEYVDYMWAENGCDHTLRHTRQYIRQQGLPEEELVEWLTEHGGGCDCEVLANVAEPWIDGTEREWKFEDDSIDEADEERWDKAFAESADKLAELADQMLAEHREGRTMPLDPDQM